MMRPVDELTHIQLISGRGGISIQVFLKLLDHVPSIDVCIYTIIQFLGILRGALVDFIFLIN